MIHRVKVTLDLSDQLRKFGGSGRIRTYGPRKETLVFKTSLINRSSTLPKISCFPLLAVIVV